jgi:hypothetical protein
MPGSVRVGYSAILFSRFLLRETLPTQSGLRFVLTPVMGKRTADDRVLNLVPAQMPKASSARTITPDSSKAPATSDGVTLPPRTGRERAARQ